jgi:transcriptional regulator with XRE-family HTH domain
MSEWKTERSKKFWADVAERLKLTRHLLGISEDEAAAAMHVSMRTYRKWERAERHRDNVMGVLAFCEKYGVSYGWLFGGDSYPAPRPRFRLRLVS